ncbi:MAG: hypothetical protein NVS2B4_17830 [Ramlibacter sp.]
MLSTCPPSHQKLKPVAVWQAQIEDGNIERCRMERRLGPGGSAHPIDCEAM